MRTFRFRNISRQDLEEDLRARDFAINAIAFDPQPDLSDP
jgi:tRNA nucleotidyltransferase/poly(A) polymerase